MISRSEISRLDRAQGALEGQAQGQLRDVFSSLPLDRPDVARDALLEAYPAVALAYGTAASTVAAEWYEEMRRVEKGGAYTARLSAPPDEVRFERTVRWAAAGLFEENASSTLALLDGSLVRSLGDFQRDTINENVQRDSAAAGWHRIAQPDGCDFCVMLSQRGAVYKRATADFASHDNCRCKIVPGWDMNAPEVDVRAYEASERVGILRRRANDPSLTARERQAARRALEDRRGRINTWIYLNRSSLEQFRAEL